MRGATQYGSESPTDPPFLERCPTINDWIRAVCELRRALWNESLNDIAKLIGIARPLLSRWISCDGPRPRDSSVEGFCLALGIEPRQILDHYGYADTADRRRARRIREAIAALEDVLSDPDLDWEERRDYEQQVISLMELAFRQRTPPQ